VTATEAAERVVERARTARRGELTITLGTGCCESTAPFLYEDFWPGPDQAVVGEVAGVAVHAPAYLRRLYPDADGVVIDVVEGVDAESLSIETEWSCRLILRGLGVDVGGDETCAAPAKGSAVARARLADAPGRTVRGELPPELQRLRMR
jgi:uncharacterized protein (DUF779 family)